MALTKAYGGVLFDETGRVLLRNPANNFDGYVWTFPKGRQNPREAPETAALREVLEETGIDARIIAKIPGCYEGVTTSNEYFLMESVSVTRKIDWETAEIRWVEAEEAVKLISQTTNKKGRERDLRVFEMALEQFNKIKNEKTF